MNGRTNSNGTTTDTIQIPLDPVTNLDAVAGNAQITLTWTDPLNKYATPEGEQAGDPDQLVSVWSYTAIVRKEGSAPTGIHDGILVAESQVHNQYQMNGYVDSGLTNDTLYYYGLFAVNEDGIESEVTAISAMPKAGTLVQDLAVGTIININEDGAPVEYLVVNQGNPDPSFYDETCNGTWVLRKDISSLEIYYDNNTTHPAYPFCDISEYLDGTYKSRYSTTTLSNIMEINIPYCATRDGEIDKHTCIFFPLSFHEAGFTTIEPIDGSKLSYFIEGYTEDAYAKRIAYYNDTAETWWLRNKPTNMAGGCAFVTPDGGTYSSSPGGDRGVRAACILNPIARVDATLNLVTE